MWGKKEGQGSSDIAESECYAALRAPASFAITGTADPLVRCRQTQKAPRDRRGFLFDATGQARSKRSRFITLFQAATKSFTNFASLPSQA